MNTIVDDWKTKFIVGSWEVSVGTLSACLVCVINDVTVKDDSETGKFIRTERVVDYACLTLNSNSVD